MRRTLRKDLAALDRFPVPSHFNHRVLAALYPAAKEVRQLASTAARIYLALSCVLGLMALSLSALLIQRQGCGSQHR